MRLFISCDMEGVAGVADWLQVTPGEEGQVGRRLMLGEVNAAIDGALEAGASSVLVNDSHGGMRNLAPEELHGEAEYCSGQHKPLYMMEGLDADFDACFFVGYHGAVDGPPSALSHTYNPLAILGVSLGGRVVGEAGVNALVAAHFGVPVALVSGDQHTAAQAEAILPGAELVVVKQSVTRLAARSLHPELAKRRIKEAARRSLERLSELAPPPVGPPWRLLVKLRNADLAELAAQVRGVSQLSTLEVAVEGEDGLSAFRSFVGLIQITRGIAQER